MTTIKKKKFHKSALTTWVGFRALLVSIVSAVSLVASGLITSRLGAKYLSAEELQLWFLMLGALPFCMLLDLGAYSILPGKLAASRQLGDNDALQRYIATFFQTATGIVLGVAAIAAIGIPLAFGNKAWPNFTTLIPALSLAIAARVIQNIILGILFAGGDIAVEKSLKTLGSVMSVLPMPVLLAQGFSVFSMPASWLISSSVVIVLATHHVSKHTGPLFSASRFSRALAGSIIRTSSTFLVAALPGMFIYNILPYRVAHDFGPSFTIQIGLATQISMGVTLMCAIPTSLFVKKIADEYFSFPDDQPRSRHLITNVRIVSIISTGALTTIFIFHRRIFEIWLGKDLPFDASFLLFYALAIWFEIQQTTLTTSLISTGYVTFWRVTSLSALLTVLAYTPLTYWFGFMGVAITCLSAQLITCHFWNTQKTLTAFGISFTRYARQHLLSCGLMGCIIVINALMSPHDDMGILIAVILTGLALIKTLLDRQHE